MPGIPMIRRIMHVDMDAFYASVEQVDHPEMQGQPVIVGGSTRGVVSAASYEARKFGIHSAMPIFQARRLCPHGIFVPVNMRRYRQVSCQVMRIIEGISPLVEQISIDEAYVDITGTESLHGSSRELAARLKERIRAATGLTCSIGIAPNKFLAKIASDLRKPDGLFILDETGVQRFLQHLPVDQIPGIGRRTSEILKGLGVATASDVLRFPLSFWVRRLGKYGARLHEKAQGLDFSPVIPDSAPKSCSAEDTFPKDISDPAELRKRLLLQAESVGRELRRDGFFGRTVTLKVKFADFSVITRSRTLHEPTHCTRTIFEVAVQLLDEVQVSRKVRLTGVAVSNLCSGVQQMKLFKESAVAKQERLDRAMDVIESRFGREAVKRGILWDLD
ncbi:DNA polymerase IV [Desulfoferrobacter suflitae]|uniref:DNA polymerase IV n=1 Tax=Desulfoferrobacter suflitae TaxID=2865782 RepID=UPI002164DD2E|nr:DNA polymerase IV [Desulfoferrobacter suflitae]MCK8601881.1 DNA polymerase IV [Desulfoferrobacter suflitae]